MDKYVELAIQLKMTSAAIIAPTDISFDQRVLLKCIWGCNQHTVKCDTRGTTFQEYRDMIRQYQRILIVHAHDGSEARAQHNYAYKGGGVRPNLIFVQYLRIFSSRRRGLLITSSRADRPESIDF